MNAILSEAKFIVAAAIRRGECSQPVFTRPITNADIIRARCKVDGSTMGRTPKSSNRECDKFGESTLKDYLTKFLEKHETEFTPVHFINWLSRSKLTASKGRVRMLLVRAIKAGSIVLVKHGSQTRLPVYKKALPNLCQ